MFTSFSSVGYTEYLQLLVGKSDTSEHQSVATERFDRVDSHTAHQLLDFVLPSAHQVDESLITEIGIEALDKLGRCVAIPQLHLPVWQVRQR